MAYIYSHIGFCSVNSEYWEKNVFLIRFFVLNFLIEQRLTTMFSPIKGQRTVETQLCRQTVKAGMNGVF